MYPGYVLLSYESVSRTCFGVYRYIGAVRLEYGGIRVQVGALVHQPALGYHPTPAEPHQYTNQYTPKQNSTPTYSRQLLRMNVITFETC